MIIRSVIAELARRMQGRLDYSWSAALIAAAREHIVDPVLLQLERARLGEPGARWLYEEAVEPSIAEAEEIVVDEVTTVGDGPDDFDGEPEVLTLNGLIERLLQLRAERPRLGNEQVMAWPGLYGITAVRFAPNREAAFAPEHYSLMLVMQ